VSVTIDDVGKRVKCPRCGEEGVVAIDTFVSKGKKYQYLVVRHGRTKKCVVKRLAPKHTEGVTPKPAPKPGEVHQNLTQPVTPKPEEPAPKPHQNGFGEGKPSEDALRLVYALYEYLKAQDRLRRFLRGEKL